MDNSVEDSGDTSFLGENGFVDVSFSNTDQHIDEYEGGTSNDDVQKNKDILQSADTVNKRSDSKESCNEIVKKYSAMEDVTTIDTQTCSKKTDNSLLESESVMEFLNESDETLLTEKCTEVLESEVPFQSICTAGVINTINGDSQSGKDMGIPNLQTINEADVEVSLTHDCSDTEGETTVTRLPDIHLDKNELSGTLPTTVRNNSDNSSLCSSNDRGPDDLTPQNVENVDTLSVLPSFDQIFDNDLETSSNLQAVGENFPTHRPIISFDQICDNDLEINANLNEADENVCKDVISSQIPNFEMLQNDIHETASIRSSGFEDSSLIDLLKDIKNDLISRSDNDDYGLTHLFEESHRLGAKQCVKSKSARKRKKQQQKLRKLVANQETEKSGRKFAQSFQELQSSQIVFYDHDIDTSITCPVCLEMYHMPSTCNPCSHVFCDPCLRRLTGQGSEGIPCPLCRTVISSCELDKDFDEYLLLEHPDIYTARAMLERHTKFRHYQLPYTAPIPLGKRLMRQLIASRSNQSDTRWMSHDWFKFLLGCTAGMCLSLLIMLFNRVKSVRDARDVNIVFLSILIGAFLTFLIFKYMKI